MIKELDTMQKRAKLIESAIKAVEQELKTSQVGAVLLWFSFHGVIGSGGSRGGDEGDASPPPPAHR